MSWSEFEPRAKRRVEQASLADSEPQPAHPAAVLVELCELLEAYGPFWYAEKLRARVIVALRILLDNLYGEKPTMPRAAPSVVPRRLTRQA
jgi:hypothetical protein